MIADDLNDEYSSQLTRVFRQIGLGFSSSSLRWLRSVSSCRRRHHHHSHHHRKLSLSPKVHELHYFIMTSIIIFIKHSCQIVHQKHLRLEKNSDRGAARVSRCIPRDGHPGKRTDQ